MAAMAAPPLFVDGLQGALRVVVDRVEHASPLRVVVVRRTRVEEAGEISALLGIQIPGIGVGALVGNGGALASVERTARLVRGLHLTLLPKVRVHPTSAPLLVLLGAVAGEMRDAAVAGGGGFNPATRDVAREVERFVEEAEAHPHFTAYDGLRDRVDDLARSAHVFLQRTLTLREDVLFQAAEAAEEEAAAAAAEDAAA